MPANSHLPCLFLLLAWSAHTFGQVIQPIRPAALLEKSGGAAAVASPGMSAGDFVFISGELRSRDKPPENFEGEVKQALEDIGTVLGAAGLDFSHVVKANVYLTDIRAFSRMNQVYTNYFKTSRPARTTVAVAALPGHASIQIACMAARSAKTVPRTPGANPNAPYSAAVAAGDLLFLSGQGSFDAAKGGLADGPITNHVRQTMENLRPALSAANLDFGHCVAANVYLTDMSNFEAMNSIYRGYFKSDLPARTTVGVSALPGGPPVEIAFIASRGPKKTVQLEGTRPSPNFSQAVAAGGLLFPAGKIGSGPSIEAQTKSALDGLGTVLKAAGRDFSSALEAKIYLIDLQDYERMNAVYRQYFTDHRPARSCVIVPKLAGGARVEITLIAAASGH